MTATTERLFGIPHSGDGRRANPFVIAGNVAPAGASISRQHRDDSAMWVTAHTPSRPRAIFFSLGAIGREMGMLQKQLPQQAGISFLVVQNGGTYTPPPCSARELHSQGRADGCAKDLPDSVRAEGFSPRDVRRRRGPSLARAARRGCVGVKLGVFRSSSAASPGRRHGTLEMTQMKIDDCAGVEVTFAAILAARECGDFEVITAAENRDTT